ncbi:carbonic anhydrase [Caminibacter sp.]
MKKLILGAALLATTSLFASGDMEKKHSYNYSHTWSYSGKTGPEYWGDLSPKYKMCKIGKNQSPVDLNRFIKAELSPLMYEYKGKSKCVLDNGHTVKVVTTDTDNYVEVDGIKFYLKQFHFHTPSENMINGKHYPMEAHFVHLDKNGNITVIAVMFKEGKYNPYMQEIISKVPTQKNKKAKLKNQFNPEKLWPKNHAYYRFNGSLTTPPCTEGVRWIVFKEPVEVSSKQIMAMEAIMGKNNRPVQPLNARVILK